MPSCKDPLKEKERRRKLSIAHTGKVLSPELCKKISESNSGENHFRFGKKLSEEHKRKIGENSRARAHIISQKLMGHLVKPSTRKKLHEAHCGEKSILWKGGISFEPYCILFNREFKERCRTFFGHICVECGTPQNRVKHTVHHVNYDKKVCCNNNRPLFVCLCNSCNARANWNRGYWEQHFTDIINGYYEGKCYLTKEEMVSWVGGQD
jgi:hypothetical protein